MENEFGSTDFIYIAFGKMGESLYAPELFAAMWDLCQALEKQEMVAEVLSLVTSKRMDSEAGGFMNVADLVPQRELSPEDLISIKSYLDTHPTVKKRFIGENEVFMNLLVRPAPERKLDSFAESVKETSKMILKDYDIHFGGMPYITGIIPSLIMQDVRLLVILAFGFMILVLLLNFRSLVALLSVLFTTLLAMLAMVGFLAYAHHFTGSDKFLFSLLNSSMPIILLTIANSDSVHFLSHFFRNYRKSGDRDIAIQKAMSELSLPIIVTSVTTILAFGTLVTAPITTMVGYGLAIGFGVFWALILSLLLVPSILHLRNWDKQSDTIRRKSILEHSINAFGNMVARYPYRTFWTGFAVVFISIYGVFLVRVEVNSVDFFDDESEVKQSILFMDDFMIGSMNLTTIVEGDILQPQSLRKMEEMQRFLESKERVTMSMSIVDVIKQMHRVVMDDDPAFETIPDTVDKVNNLFTLYSMSADPEDFASLIDYNYEKALIVTQMKSMSTDAVLDIVNDMESYIEENMGELQIKFSSTGMLMFMKDFVKLVLQSSFISIFAATFLIAVVASLFFRHYRWGLLAIIPLTGAIIINFGLMGLFGVELNHIIGLLTSIIIGVGVDFAIHFIARFKLEAKSKIKTEELMHRTISDVGYPIFLDVMSNLGFLALIFSVFQPLKAMGMLASFSMISTAMGTLVLLAPIMHFFRKGLRKTALTKQDLGARR
ncbi:MAG TPA: hypothetical protein ENN84_07760 [Candidatus Marinimicrobia bacterium]|nr:hypothetical protein [Candidatus Neomarinimicrobiota bacterium]